jgi:Lipid-binding putative hydrolase
MKRIILIGSIMVIALSSCKKENLPKVGGTSVQNLANEWWVMLTANGSDVFGIGHFRIATYNSANNNTELWVDDFENGYGFKVKTTADAGALTFAATSAANQYYDPNHPTNFPQTVTITGGKVFPGQGRSRSGNVTDSIYMQVKFSDNPNTFVLSGTARTRWAEDDY